MKKFLSLVLALVMTVSLVTVFASAKSFTDDSTITYKDAVDVISTLGVVDGYSDGSFQPNGSLTRGAAAKIICNLVLGPTTAAALSADTKPFSDVSIDNVFAGYITYCSQQGIISGYSDGTFRPAGALTGYAFLKMLLGALGYNSSVEGFTGANWSVNVAKLALGNSLTDGNDDFVGTKALTREEACLYAFNTLKATMVEYGSTTTVNVNGATVTVGGSKATEVAQGAYKNQFSGKDATLQFAERYFPKLTLTTDTDAFGAPATTWTYKGTKIGTYSDDADATYTAKVKAGTIYTDLSLTKTLTATIIEDGNDKTATTMTVSKGDTTTKTGANGVVTKVYKVKDSNDAVISLKIIEVGTYVGTVQSVKAATSSAARKITVNSVSANIPTGYTIDYTYETTNFAIDDLVSFTMAYVSGDNKYEIQSVSALTEKVSGTLTAYKGTDTNDASSSFTAGGTSYNYDRHVGFKDGDTTLISGADLKGKTSLDVYLDAYGYALYIAATESTKNYAVLIGVGSSNPYGTSSNGCTLLMPDGTKVTALYSNDDSKNVSNAAISTTDVGMICTYSVASDGTYTLTGKGVENATPATTATKLFTNGNSSFANMAAGKYTTANTLFFIKDASSTSDKYNVYTGYSAAPSILYSSGVKVSYVTNSTYTSQIDAVYVSGATTEGSGTTTFVVKANSNKVVSDSTGAYYELPVVQNGAVTTLKVKYGAGTSGSDIYTLLNNKGGYVLSNYSTNSDGIVTSVTFKNTHVNPAAATAYATGTVAAANGVVGIGGNGVKANATYYAYASSTVVYYVNSDMDAISASSISGITTDANDQVKFVMDSDDNYLTAVYVMTVD